ncbi:MAG TPA: SseB family protein [Polyangiaceae bacterium]|nr:SseB family protein [Polyangiaceae bacterium]
MSDDHEHVHDEHCGHDHEEPDALTEALLRAQSGLKSDVQALVDVLDQAEVYVPLAEDVPGVSEDEQVEMGEELTFRPHMLLDAEHRAYAVAYTDPALVEPLLEELGWETSGGPLKFIHLPLRVALDLAMESVEGRDIEGLAFNPETDLELVLRRDEVASLAAGQALPLVGYVEQLPEGPDTETQVVEGAEPPPAELLSALESAKSRIRELTGYLVQTTFNPERDREPHLTITLFVSQPDLDREALAERVMEEASPHLPSPGYADILFKDSPN